LADLNKAIDESPRSASREGRDVIEQAYLRRSQVHVLANDLHAALNDINTLLKTSQSIDAITSKASLLYKLVCA
jgi:hypothetical protein